MTSHGSVVWLRVRRWAAVLVIAASAAASLLGATLAEPSSIAAMGPLPACRYDDILTAPSGYDDWSTTLVDTILRVTKAYVPPDLVPVSDAGIGGSAKIRGVVIADLSAMTAAAKAAGNPIGVQSAYRSYTTQQSVFQGWVNQLGYKQALLVSARPGHSEHQLGLAIDFKSAAGGTPWSGTDWGLSPAGSWMRQHAWEFGWVQSYPKGKQSKTCYEYESWHFRYVGRSLAAKIHASGLTPREYLWAHFTTAVVATPSPAPGATAKPSPSPIASLAPSPAASPSESPEASASPSQALPTDSPTATATASFEPSPSPTAAPVTPAGASIDPAPIAALIGLAIGAAAIATLLLSRRRRGSIGP